MHASVNHAGASKYRHAGLYALIKQKPIQHPACLMGCLDAEISGPKLLQFKLLHVRYTLNLLMQRMQTQAGKQMIVRFKAHTTGSGSAAAQNTVRRFRSYELAERFGSGTGLGAVDPSQGLTFLSAVLSSSSRVLVPHSPFLSYHFVYSPFLFDRFIATKGRKSRFYDAVLSIKASLPVATFPAAATTGSPRDLTVPPSQSQDVAKIMHGIVQAVLGRDTLPTEPLMEVSTMYNRLPAVACACA